LFYTKPGEAYIQVPRPALAAAPAGLRGVSKHQQTHEKAAYNFAGPYFLRGFLPLNFPWTYCLRGFSPAINF
jgi:hypothetical protein